MTTTVKDPLVEINSLREENARIRQTNLELIATLTAAKMTQKQAIDAVNKYAKQLTALQAEVKELRDRLVYNGIDHRVYVEALDD